MTVDIEGITKRLRAEGCRIKISRLGRALCAVVSIDRGALPRVILAKDANGLVQALHRQGLCLQEEARE